MIFDAIWLFVMYVSLLVLIVIAGFIAFKVGVFSFKIIMDVVIAARGIEKEKKHIRRPKYRIREDNEEKDIVELLLDKIKNLRKPEVRKNYARYAYMQLFKK